MLKMLMVASRGAITRSWLVKEPPNLKQWIDIVNNIHIVEKL